MNFKTKTFNVEILDLKKIGFDFYGIFFIKLLEPKESFKFNKQCLNEICDGYHKYEYHKYNTNEKGNEFNKKYWAANSIFILSNVQHYEQSINIKDALPNKYEHLKYSKKIKICKTEREFFTLESKINSFLDKDIKKVKNYKKKNDNYKFCITNIRDSLFFFLRIEDTILYSALHLSTKNKYSEKELLEAYRKEIFFHKSEVLEVKQISDSENVVKDPHISTKESSTEEKSYRCSVF